MQDADNFDVTGSLHAVKNDMPSGRKLLRPVDAKCNQSDEAESDDPQQLATPAALIQITAEKTTDDEPEDATEKPAPVHASKQRADPAKEPHHEGSATDRLRITLVVPVALPIEVIVLLFHVPFVLPLLLIAQTLLALLPLMIASLSLLIAVIFFPAHRFDPLVHY